VTSSLFHPASTLAKLFAITERRIQQLAKEGIIPKAERGKYDLIASMRGYIKYLQERAAGRSDGRYNDEADIKLERKRLIKAQADKAEVENQKLRAELISFESVQEILNEVAVLFSSSVDALPGRLASELAGITNPAEIKTRLFDECRRIRSATADKLHRFAATLTSDAPSSVDSRCTEQSNP